jgi:Zn-finger nucleic acid-binding protein
MIVLEFEGVEIDYCPETGAIWLDAGELEQIAHLAGADPAHLASAIREGQPKKGGEKRCPRCGKRLDRVAVSETLELDRCPQGHGLWFDRGELAALVASTAKGEAAASVARFFARVFHHDLNLKETDSGTD